MFSKLVMLHVFKICLNLYLIHILDDIWISFILYHIFYLSFNHIDKSNIRFRFWRHLFRYMNHFSIGICYGGVDASHKLVSTWSVSKELEFFCIVKYMSLTEGSWSLNWCVQCIWIHSRSSWYESDWNCITMKFVVIWRNAWREV